MIRIAVFGGRTLRSRLKRTAALEYEFVGAPGARPVLERSRFAAALLPVTQRTSPRQVADAQRALPGRPLGGLAIRPDERTLRRIARLRLDFVVEAWGKADPPPEAVLAHLRGGRRAGARQGGLGPRATSTSARRLAILTDVVKTANSILEPRKVIELVVEKIRQLIPSEAWSLLMVDEEKQELVFEAALGAKGQRGRGASAQDRRGRRRLGGRDRQARDRQRRHARPALRAARRRQDLVRDALDPVRAARLARPHDRRARDPQQARRRLHARPTWSWC